MNPFSLFWCPLLNFFCLHAKSHLTTPRFFLFTKTGFSAIFTSQEGQKEIQVVSSLRTVKFSLTGTGGCHYITIKNRFRTEGHLVPEHLLMASNRPRARPPRSIFNHVRLGWLLLPLGNLNCIEKQWSNFGKCFFIIHYFSSHHLCEKLVTYYHSLKNIPATPTHTPTPTPSLSIITSTWLLHFTNSRGWVTPILDQ